MNISTQTFRAVEKWILTVLRRTTDANKRTSIFKRPLKKFFKKNKKTQTLLR